MYAKLAVNLGYTPDQIDELTLDFYFDLCRYWDDVCPPLDIIAAAQIGWKPRAKAEPEKKSDLSELASFFGKPNAGG